MPSNRKLLVEKSSASVLRIETPIKAPIEQCFDLARDVEAHIASTVGSKERVVAGVHTGLLGLSDEVTWVARHLGLPWRLTSRITEFDRPSRFVDMQVEGPFRSWWHEHRFESNAGAIKMIDLVRYQLPLGVVGWSADRLLLNRYLRVLLERRAIALKEIAETRTVPS